MRSGAVPGRGTAYRLEGREHQTAPCFASAVIGGLPSVPDGYLHGFLPHIQQGSVLTPGEPAHELIICNPALLRVVCVGHIFDRTDREHGDIFCILIYEVVDFSAGIAQGCFLQTIGSDYRAQEIGNTLLDTVF